MTNYWNNSGYADTRLCTNASAYIKIASMNPATCPTSTPDAVLYSDRGCITWVALYSSVYNTYVGIKYDAAYNALVCAVRGGSIGHKELVLGGPFYSSDIWELAVGVYPASKTIKVSAHNATRSQVSGLWTFTATDYAKYMGEAMFVTQRPLVYYGEPHPEGVVGHQWYFAKQARPSSGISLFQSTWTRDNEGLTRTLYTTPTRQLRRAYGKDQPGGFGGSQLLMYPGTVNSAGGFSNIWSSCGYKDPIDAAGYQGLYQNGAYTEYGDPQYDGHGTGDPPFNNAKLVFGATF